jgi:hypothetical protein
MMGAVARKMDSVTLVSGNGVPAKQGMSHDILRGVVKQ